jgi:hypothetical protein
MSLQDDLKGKTLALISQQMNNWVVEIQRHIGRHQEGLMRVLDELQETVARYDEKIDEAEIGRAMAEVVSDQPPPAPTGPGFDRLKASLATIEKGASLSEVLTYLVNEVAQFVPRAAMFIVKGPSAIGWYARGFEGAADAVKQINVPLAADTILRTVHNQREALRVSLDASPGTREALARLGGRASGALAVPLVLRDKLAAILYCDTNDAQVQDQVADLVELLVLFSGKIVDVLSVAPKPAVGRTTTSGTSAERAAAIRSGGDEVRERAGVPPAAARPAPVAAPPAPPTPLPASPGTSPDESSSTIMFNPAAVAQARQAAAAASAPPPAARPASPPPAAPAAPLSPEGQKAHEDAKRFARLVVSEIKLYNETKVNEGRRAKDLYERLKEDVERGRQMYMDRVAAPIRETTNYFYDELVRILAGGDPSALGPM